jgi:hypothetical protein
MIYGKIISLAEAAENAEEKRSVLIRVHPRPIRSFVIKSLANMKSVFICTTYLQTLKILLSIRDTILDNCWNLLTLMIS